MSRDPRKDRARKKRLRRREQAWHRRRAARLERWLRTISNVALAVMFDADLTRELGLQPISFVEKNPKLAALVRDQLLAQSCYDMVEKYFDDNPEPDA